MTKEQANKFLYLVALFSFLTLLSTILTSEIVFPMLMKNKLVFIEAIVFIIFQLLLIAAPFLRDNRYLFLMILVAYLSDFFDRLIDLLGYIFSSEYHLAKIGVVPGWFSMGSFVLLSAVGLTVLFFRCYGYVKEHWAGLKTQF